MLAQPRRSRIFISHKLLSFSSRYYYVCRDDLDGGNFTDHFGLAGLENRGMQDDSRQKPRQRVFESLKSIRDLLFRQSSTYGDTSQEA